MKKYYNTCMYVVMCTFHLSEVSFIYALQEIINKSTEAIKNIFNNVLLYNIILLELGSE